MTTTMILATLLAACLGGIVAFGFTRFVYRMRLQKSFDRIEYVLQVRAQTSELLMQARRQVESLTQELDHARSLRAMPARPSTPTPTPTPLAGRRAPPSIVVNDDDNGFADTMMSQDAAPTVFSDTLISTDDLHRNRR